MTLRKYLNSVTISKGMLAFFMILSCMLVPRHDGIRWFLNICF